ncbi:hypothetical protein CLOM_g14818 [Closterium sp. NIES-68]|nr:hypothetical protein CLOM_g14818 [Closterium sp. NIES-68]
MSLPISYYEVLRVHPETPTATIDLMLDSMLASPPKEGFTVAALTVRAEVLEAARDTLLDAELRAEYDEDLKAAAQQQALGGGGRGGGEYGGETAIIVDVPMSRVPGVLCLLQEAGRSADVAEAGLDLLSRPDGDPAFRADVALATALAYSDLSRDAMSADPPAVAQGCELLEAALKLLQDEGGPGLAPSLQAAIEDSLREMGPTRVLELLALPLDKEHEEGRGEGIQGSPLDAGPRRFSLLYLPGRLLPPCLHAGSLLTPDNVRVDKSLCRRPTHIDAGILEAYWVALAFAGRGFFLRRPADIVQSDALLKELNESTAYRLLVSVSTGGVVGGATGGEGSGAVVSGGITAGEGEGAGGGEGSGAGEAGLIAGRAGGAAGAAAGAAGVGGQGGAGSAMAMVAGTDVPADLSVERAMCALLLGQVGECKRWLGVHVTPPSGDLAVAEYIYANSPSAPPVDSWYGSSRTGNSQPLSTIVTSSVAGRGSASSGGRQEGGGGGRVVTRAVPVVGGVVEGGSGHADSETQAISLLCYPSTLTTRQSGAFWTRGISRRVGGGGIGGVRNAAMDVIKGVFPWMQGSTDTAAGAAGAAGAAAAAAGTPVENPFTLSTSVPATSSPPSSATPPTATASLLDDALQDLSSSLPPAELARSRTRREIFGPSPVLDPQGTPIPLRTTQPESLPALGLPGNETGSSSSSGRGGFGFGGKVGAMVVGVAAAAVVAGGGWMAWRMRSGRFGPSMLGVEGAMVGAAKETAASSGGAAEEEYSEVEEVQWAVRVVRHWQEVKAAALGPSHRVDRLGEILEGPMLELWRNRAKEVEGNGWFWEYSFLSLNVEMAAVSKCQKKAVVEAVVQEAARLVDAADPTHNDAYRSTYTARYELVQTGTCWKIVGGTVLR